MTRIRIRLGSGTVTSCGYVAQGETEDYTAEIANALGITSISGNVLCGGEPLDVTCSGGPPFNTGNVFSIQLSDDAGSFSNPQVIGTLTSTQPGTVLCTVPLDILSGIAYKVRVVTTNPVTTSNDNGSAITLFKSRRERSQNINTVCNGDVDGSYVPAP